MLFIVVIGFLVISTTAVCPSNWIPYRDSKCFKLLANTSTGDNIRSQCLREGQNIQDEMIANLSIPLKIEKLDEELFIANEFPNKKLWLGMQRDADGVLQWIDGPSTDYRDWNYDMGAGNCVIINTDEEKAQLGRWKEAICSEKHNTVCQIPQTIHEKTFQNYIIKSLYQLRNDMEASNLKISTLSSQFQSLVETVNKHEVKLREMKLRFTPKSCAEFYYQGYRTDGVYTILPTRGGSLSDAYCDMTSFGGGWTNFQRRGYPENIPKIKRTSFNKNWEDYKLGFGNASSDYWLGLENVYFLTKDCDNELLITVTYWNGTLVYARYSNFKINGECDAYRLTVSGFTGNITLDNEDDITWHNGEKFSTIDRDNDRGARDCAKEYQGGWWFRFCYTIFLNGQYADDGTDGKHNFGDWKGISWNGHGKDYSFRKTEMKIRSKCKIHY